MNASNEVHWINYNLHPHRFEVPNLNLFCKLRHIQRHSSVVLLQLEEQGVLTNLTEEIERLGKEIDKAFLKANSKKIRRYAKYVNEDSGRLILLWQIIQLVF